MVKNMTTVKNFYNHYACELQLNNSIGLKLG